MAVLRRVIPGLLLAALLVGCRGGGTSSSPTTTEVPTTTTTLSQIELDKTKAARVVLSASDLPGYSLDRDGALFKASAATCVNNSLVLARIGEANDPRGARSEAFAKGAEVDVDSSVTFADTEDGARAAMNALTAPSFAPCFARALTNQPRTDKTVTNVSATTTRLPELTLGDRSAGYRSVVKAQRSGRPLVVNADFTFVRVGRGLAVLNASATNTAFPEAERARLVTLLADRLAAP